MSNEPIRLFSYGTLQLETVQLETFGRLLVGTADALPGYGRTMVRITDPAVIAASGADHHPIVAASGDPNDTVEGTVFEITAEELAAADTYEVSDYKRVEVVLASGLWAFVYIQA
jgi:hypothetical protein